MSRHTAVGNLTGLGTALNGGKAWTRYLVPLGRVAYAWAHVWYAPLNFTPPGIAEAGRQGVPIPGVLVPLAGIISLAGGLSVMVGYRARIGAWLLIIFLVPVTLWLHNFWAVKDPMMALMQQGFFIANVSRMGAALLIAHFGAGPVSLDARGAFRAS